MAKTKKKVSAKKVAKDVTKSAKVNEKVNPLSKETKKAQSFLSELKLSESYVSLMLGAVVVLVLSAVFFMFMRSGALNGTSELSDTKPLPVETTLQNPRTYTLREGEGLWDVAVTHYGDGYKWVEIAKANNLTEAQANKLGPGSKIIIPNIK